MEKLLRGLGAVALVVIILVVLYLFAYVGPLG